jgi:selenocysteine lyase/cysteine desulfurase
MNSAVRSHFPVTKKLTYLDTAYVGPPPVPVLQANQEFVERRSQGTAGRVADWVEVMEQVRCAVATLINSKPNEIAFSTNTSAGTNMVASALNLCPGDNVIWDDLEYPSNKLVWLHQQSTKGVENRIVSSQDGAVGVDDYARMVDNRTKLICVSHVTHRNGYRHDITRLANLAHSVGAYLHVDAIQAIGAIKVDAKNAGVDFLTCGTYKWLLGPIGLAFFYVREELLPALEPDRQGWMQVRTWASDPRHPAAEMYSSARKFESATLNFQGMYELRAALAFINEIGMDRIEQQVLRLSSKLRKGLAGLNADLITPPETRSGIVTCAVQNENRMAQLMAENRIITTVRDGEMRISPHFFNTEKEIDRLLDVMASS